MSIKEINERYCVRNFADIEPANDQILKILEAGRLAPSWMNVQPWQFIVIRDKDTRKLLSELAHGQPHVANAPVIIACCGDTSAWDSENFGKILKARSGITEENINNILSNPVLNPKAKGEDAIIYRTIEELTYSIAYMTLEAQSMGWGTCIIGAIGNDLNGSLPEKYKQVREKLNLPDHLMLVTLLLVGYPDPESKKPDKLRKSPEEIFSFEKYGNRIS